MPLPPDTELGQILLARARHAIAHELGAERCPPNGDPRLGERGATFVTIKRGGDLRGCIGSVRAQRSLGEDVVINAVGAATRDPRFPPMSRDELDKVDIEVSLLSSPEFVEFADESDLMGKLRPGVDGVLLFSGCRSATFLPQVWEQLPEPQMFLAALKQKAGLAPDRPAPNLMAATYTVRKWKER
ncbi:AmmeMemoRadiSam system protein A [Aromatoleum petrolei]|uniref:AmmeMemoRadiSam system protein A n=1 Tax=Aromatoleum petrolei TaxID=76116 RepID=A0ABX1MHZ7_9RHOO|nr:AmmeMemoRadiSam system protein A [Aromatoleum petrolei]NMF87557.1 AmmeMemoRadiSam system protein A [Aromatoleum petrolei]QTQ38654.1 AmmeMemoRadiSam system protein A [Aromatoleum petrolei]